jgi:hypothetical protein
MKNTLLALLLMASTAHADQPQREYDRRSVEILDSTTVTPHGSVVHATVPLLGKYKEPLDTPGFFDAVDQPKLADQYREKARAKLALVAAGGLSILGGVLASTTGGILWASSCNGAEITHKACDTTAYEATTFAGVGVFAAGLTLTIAGGAISLPGYTTEQAHDWADAHNQRLRDELGLTP